VLTGPVSIGFEFLCRDKNLCKDMTTEEEEEEEKVYYKVNFKIKENYAVELELEDYDTLDQVLEDLEEVWNKSTKTRRFGKRISYMKSTKKKQFHFCVFKTLERSTKRMVRFV